MDETENDAFEEGDCGPEPEKQEFLSQIAQLHEAVETMKSAFTTAQLELVSIGLEDKSLQEEMTQTKAHCQQQTGEILRLVLALKAEIIALRETLETTQLIQHGLDSRLQSTLLERDLLLQELTSNGAISQQLRDKLLRCRSGVGGNGGANGALAGRSSSGSQSTNDSGVASQHEHGSGSRHHDLLLDFGAGDGDVGKSSGALACTSSLPSSSNSANNLNGAYHHHLSPTQHVQSYLNTLNASTNVLLQTGGGGVHRNNIMGYPNGHAASTSSSSFPSHPHHSHNDNDYPSLNSSSSDDSSTSSNNMHDGADEAGVGVGAGGGILVYDSDSSLTVAAAAALSLSTSLSKQCGLELDAHQNGSSRHKHNLQLHNGKECEDDDREPQKSTTITKQRQHAHVDMDSEFEAEDAEVVAEAKEPAFLDARTRHHADSATGGQRQHQHEHERLLLGAATTTTTELSFEEMQRLRVARELVETERKYCHTLRTIEDIFASPLRDSGVLSATDIETLFPAEVGLMHVQHCRLLTQLDQRLAAWTPASCIGDLIEEFTRVDGSDILRLYTSYVNDFPEVLKTFHKLCRTSAEFTRFLKHCLQQPACGGLDLGAFLLTPVQRMPRYILLLKQMLKWTSHQHPDHERIALSLNRLRDYLTKLNDSMEHSFQLVTAQIIPQSQSQQFLRRDGVERREYFEDSHNPSRGSQMRNSTSSESSGGTNAKEEEPMPLKSRYRRSQMRPHVTATASTSASRRESSGSLCSKINKLRTRSKSDWAVSKRDGVTANKYMYYQDDDFSESDKQHAALSAQLLERSISDSDINSDLEESGKDTKRSIQASKSLHDFKRQPAPEEEDDEFDWALRSLATNECKDGDGGRTGMGVGVGRTVVRKTTLLRPFLPPQPSSAWKHECMERHLVRIERGSQPELSQKGKKRMSLRASLKNLFSLRRRYSKISSRDTSTSTAETASQFYRVVYKDCYGHGHAPPQMHLQSQHGHSSSINSCSTHTHNYCSESVQGQQGQDELHSSLLSISPLVRYMHRMPSYLELVMFSVKETTV